MVHQHLRKAKKSQPKYDNRNSEYTEFQVGDSVYCNQQQQKSKLQDRWCHCCHILYQKLDGTITKTHVEHIRFTNLDDCELPKDKKGRHLCKTRYVGPMSSSSSDAEYCDTKPPLSKMVKKSMKQSETSSEEDVTPLREFEK